MLSAREWQARPDRLACLLSRGRTTSYLARRPRALLLAVSGQQVYSIRLLATAIEELDRRVGIIFTPVATETDTRGTDLHPMTFRRTTTLDQNEHTARNTAILTALLGLGDPRQLLGDRRRASSTKEVAVMSAPQVGVPAVISADAFRDVMATVCAPVTVVTTTTADGKPYGTTVSAFASLSLDPPLVMIALGNRSGLLAHARASGRIGGESALARSASRRRVVRL
jgi:hypothetical protein